MSAQDRTPDERLAVFVDARDFADRDCQVSAYLFGWHATMTRGEYVAACAAASKRTGAEIEPRPDVLETLPEDEPLAARLAHAITAEGGSDNATGAAVTADHGDNEGAKREAFGVPEVVAYVLDRYVVGRSNDGRLIAVPHAGPRICRTLSGMKSTVAADIYRDEQRTPSPTTRATAFEILEGMAAEADPLDVHLRAAYDDDARTLHIDLSDSARTIVRVDADGWRITDAVTPIFRRSSATSPLPRPTVDVDGTAREELAELLGLSVDSATFRLLWGWAVAAYFDHIARPLLWVVGEQGSGKTTRAKMILGLVDPADELGRDPGRNERDDSTSAAGRYVPTWDNLRSISESTSDWICRLVTGVTLDRRALYTDDGVHTSTLRRTGLATSISLPHGLGPDAVERLILVPLQRITDGARQDETTLARRFAEIRPRLLGALLDDVAGVIAHRDDVRVDTLPRMADYALVLHALDAATGGEYVTAYLEACSSAMRDTVEADPWLSAVVELAHRTPAGPSTAAGSRVFKSPSATRHGRLTGDGWEGTAAELVDELAHKLAHGGKYPGERGVWSALERQATPLRVAGVEVDRRKSNGLRLIVLRRVSADDVDGVELAA